MRLPGLVPAFLKPHSFSRIFIHPTIVEVPMVGGLGCCPEFQTGWTLRYSSAGTLCRRCGDHHSSQLFRGHVFPCTKVTVMMATICLDSFVFHFMRIIASLDWTWRSTVVLAIISTETIRTTGVCGLLHAVAHCSIQCRTSLRWVIDGVELGGHWYRGLWLVLCLRRFAGADVVQDVSITALFFSVNTWFLGVCSHAGTTGSSR